MMNNDNGKSMNGRTPRSAAGDLSRNGHGSPRAPESSMRPDSARATLMAHMMAFFPTREDSLAIARGLTAGGAAYLEVQFPFSDPSADGPLIQTAGAHALEAGFTVEGGFDLVREIVAMTHRPVFVMSYGNLVFRRGTEAFVRAAKEAGAAGLIIPDLAPGNDEHLYEAGEKHGVAIVPVVAPSVTDLRIARIAEEHPRYLYAALRLGITGSYTDVGDENLRFLGRLAPLHADIIAGFGISSPDQVRLLAPHVHALVVGSAFVKTIIDALDADHTSDLETTLRRQVHALVSGGVA